jgi:predicted transposase YdaD
MSFDNLCKLLAQKYPDRVAAWILGEPQPLVIVLKTELSIEQPSSGSKFPLTPNS